MSESTAAMLCRPCGQAAPGMSGTCPHCGSPLATAGPAEAGPATPGHAVGGTATAGLGTAGGQVSAPASVPAQRAQPQPADVPAYRFAPARVASGPGLSRRSRLAIGVSGAVVVLAVAAFLVLRPAPPSPGGTVRDYCADLGRGDTAAALGLVDAGGETVTPASAPLLVPAALANAANRPTGATVTATRTEATGAGGNLTAVAVTYKAGGHPVAQVFEVVATGDKKTPYRLEQPFLYLTVESPEGLAATVNGIAVDADRLAQGTAAFPGAYQATTKGNALFAGATQNATYQPGTGGVRADIAFGQPALAPGAAQSVQAAAQQLLDANCVNAQVASYNYECPLRAPDDWYDQMTVWKITNYPQLQLSAGGPGRNEVAFSTSSPGTAGYTITYTDFDGATQTHTGTVPIDISGYAEIGDNGVIQLTLDY